MHSQHPMRHGLPPEWASDYGFDSFGPYAIFTVGEATQYLRWIAPQTFTMGGEGGESPRPVAIETGYWVATTPVTQALWTAVMGSNPSEFKHPLRPVETVSWDDVQVFLTKLDALMPWLEMRLPTEVEWECACRAGTTTDTWLGDLDIKGENNAPILDSIAWYGGNSGVDFDLEYGWDASSWPEKQYEFGKTGTRIIAFKEPNPWGLYDMLGNVWEWCSDTVNEDAYRMLRGGSWRGNARRVRAVFRNRHAPGVGHQYLGFRLFRGPSV